MARTHHTVIVARPIEEVFAVLTDVTLTGRWFPLDVEERWTSAPPHGVGSTRRARIRMLGRVQENEAMVTAYDPPRLAAIAGTSPNAPFDATLRFASVDAGTKVDAGIEIRMGGILTPIGAVFARWYGGKWDEGLINLKRLMEAGGLRPSA